MIKSLFAILTAGFFAVALGTVATAQDTDGPKIRSVIQSQIDAFQKDDFASAFSFASPKIRQMFGTSDRFGMMVRQGYPMVWRPQSVEFLDLRDIGGQFWQVVLMRDADGAYHTLGYQMSQAADGVWQIDGVQILREEELGA